MASERHRNEGAFDIMAGHCSPSTVQRYARYRGLDSSEFTHTRIPALAALMLLLSSAAFAQNVSAEDAMPGHGFIAVAPVSMTDDSLARLRNSRLTDEQFWLVDTAVFVTRNLGLGVEVMPLGSVTRHDGFIFATQDAAEDEHAVLIMARARSLAKRRFALDVVFGGGIASQHLSIHSGNSDTGLVQTMIIDRIVDEKTAALSVGIDGPLSLVPHLALLPLVRLRLVNHSAEADNNGWSSRFTVGIGAGVKW